MKDKIRYITTIFILITCNIWCTYSLRILGIFPLNSQSHYTFCERLTRGLAERGHQVDIYSHTSLKKPVPNYKHVSLAGSVPAIVNNVTYNHFQQYFMSDIDIVSSVGCPSCESLNTTIFRELISSLKNNQPYDVVLVEMFLSNCYLAFGRYLNIPLVGIMPSTLMDWFNEPLGNPFSPATTPRCWSTLTHPMNFWERLTNTYKYYTRNAQFKYHINKQNKYVEEFFGPGYPDASDLAKDIDLLIVNTHHAIDGIRAITPAIIPVGGLHIVDDDTQLPKDVEKWLDGSKDGCIYVSFGSMVRIETFPKPILDIFYASFKNISPIRVLMKIVKPEELPLGLPSNVMAQTWLPQVKILKHKNMKGFVTHGGLMSWLESIYAGVPLIGIPLFNDQQSNVMRQTKNKLGTMVQLSDLTEETLTTAIQKVLSNSVYKENMKKLSRVMNDRPMDPLETAVFWIEYIVRHGKGSLRSPIVDMPWYQVHLIDVYGFILLSIIIVTYLLILIFKMFKALCCSENTDQQLAKIKKN